MNQSAPISEVPPPALTFDCPHCRARLTGSPSQAGTTTACPKCDGRFQIPLPTAIPNRNSSRSDLAVSDEYNSFVSKKIAAGICGIILGGLGIHKFILGLTKPAVIMLVVWVCGIITGVLVLPLFAAIAMNVIGFVEGIIYLTKTDEDFYRTYAVEKKEWF